MNFSTKYLNIKCVIFTFYIALLYWYLPRNNLSIATITVINYLLVNIYNNIYMCKNRSVYSNILVTFIISSMLMVLPEKNKYVLVLALYLPYFILAWYDYFMNCSFRMNPTIFPYGRYIYLPIKPPPYKQRFKDLDPIVLENIRNFDKFVTTSIVLSIIIYIVLKLV